MIREALEYLIGLGAESNPLIEINNKPYSVKQLHPIKETGPVALGFNFLDSLITYLKKDPDDFRQTTRLIIEIENPIKLALRTQITGKFYERFAPVYCTALVSEFPWGQFLSPEEFIIMTQSHFVETEDLIKIRAIAGNVKGEEVIQFSDDGVSQQVTAKTGIARVENVVIPPRVKLAPYRTFIEIAQPESEFIFRARKANGLPNFALFEADGGAWRIEAMKRIKAYLEQNLKGINNVIILG